MGEGVDRGSVDSLYPVFIDVKEKRCVFVGAGRVGERKIRGVLEGGGQNLLVVSPVATERVRAWAEESHLEWRACAYGPEDLDGATLVFAATGSSKVNAKVVSDARERGILVNGADRHTRGDFMGASTLRRGDFQIAISSGGSSPAYVRLLREILDGALGHEHETFARFLGELRPRVHKRFPDDIRKRESVWKELVSHEVLGLAREGRWDRIEIMVDTCLS